MLKINLKENRKTIIVTLAVVFFAISSLYVMAKVKNKIEDQQRRISKLETKEVEKQEAETRTTEDAKKQEDEARLLSEQQKIVQDEQQKKEVLDTCESRKKECPGKIASSKQAVIKNEADYKNAKQDYERNLEDKVQKCKDSIGDNNNESLRKMQEQKCELQGSLGVIGSSSLDTLENKFNTAKEQLNSTIKYCTNYQNPCE